MHSVTYLYLISLVFLGYEVHLQVFSNHCKSQKSFPIYLLKKIHVQVDLHSPIPHCPSVNGMLNCGALNSYAGKNSHSRPMTTVLLKGLVWQNWFQGSHHSLTDKGGLMHLNTNKSWCWSWNSNTLATGYEELTKRLWCWEKLGAGGEGDDRGWDGRVASLTQWTWVLVDSGSWW